MLTVEIGLAVRTRRSEAVVTLCGLRCTEAAGPWREQKILNGRSTFAELLLEAPNGDQRALAFCSIKDTECFAPTRQRHSEEESLFPGAFDLKST